MIKKKLGLVGSRRIPIAKRALIQSSCVENVYLLLHHANAGRRRADARSSILQQDHCSTNIYKVRDTVHIWRRYSCFPVSQAHRQRQEVILIN